LWDVRVENVTAHVKEVWVLEYRYLGPGLARGNFHVQPARWYEVYPASLQLEGGEVTLGTAAVAHRAYAYIDCKVDNSNTRKLSGLEPFTKIHAGVRGRFEGTELAFLDAYLGPHAGVSATGTGDVELDARLERGVVTPGTKIEVRSANASVGNARLRVAGPVSLRLEVPRGGLGEPLELGVRSERLALAGPKAPHGSPTIEHLDARLAVTSDVTQPLAVVGADVGKLKLSVPDLGWISRLDDGFPKLGGNADFVLDGHRDEKGRWNGSAEARGDGVAVKTKQFDARGTLRADTRFVSAPGEKSFTFAPSHLVLSQAVLAADGHATPPSQLTVTSEEVVLRPNDEDQTATGTVSVHADDARSLLPLVVDSPVMRRIEGALLGLQAFDAKASFRLGETSRLELLRAQAGIAKARGLVTMTKNGPTGAFLVSTGVANLGVRVRSGETRGCAWPGPCR
jgi:hypothetical protein